MLSELGLDPNLLETILTKQERFVDVHSSSELIEWSDRAMTSYPFLFHFQNRNKHNIFENDPHIAGRIYPIIAARTFLAVRLLYESSNHIEISGEIVEAYRHDAIEDLYRHFYSIREGTPIPQIQNEEVINAFDNFGYSAPKFNKWAVNFLEQDDRLADLIVPIHYNESDPQRFFAYRAICDIAYPMYKAFSYKKSKPQEIVVWKPAELFVGGTEGNRLEHEIL